MVTIIGYKESQKENGESFFKLKLEGSAELVQSKETSKFYLTTRTCYISTTFQEETCKKLLGTEMAGTIEKVEVEPYDYTVPATGEVITLHHSWEYSPIEPENQLAKQKTDEQVAKQEMGW